MTQVDNNIQVTVVVSGAPVPVKVNVHQKVEQLMREALHDAGKRDVDLSRWFLRHSGGGEPIAAGLRVDQAGITSGATLFLDPDEGGGGV